MTKSKRPKKGRETEAIHVEVISPRIHTCQGAKFVDYEVFIRTSNIAFSRKESSIRRRYSDFIWLRNKLSTNEVNGFGSDRVVPSLPPKRLFGRFEAMFLRSRKNGLQEFLDQVLNIKEFLSYSGLHLFLQSQLTVQQIEDYIAGKYKSDLTVDNIIANEEQETSSNSSSAGCSLTTCHNVALSNPEEFTFIDYYRDEDAQSFHSSVMASGESSISINSNGYFSDPQETRALIYTAYK